MEPATYVLYIFSGLVPLMAFNQGLVQGSGSLATNREILLSTIFPAELVPLRECAATVASLVIGLIVTALFGLGLGKAAWMWILVPVFLALLLLMLSRLSSGSLSLVNLVFKDIQQLLSYVTIVLLVASPIAYTPSMLSAKMQIIIYLNPLAYFVIAFQSLIVLGENAPASDYCRLRRVCRRLICAWRVDFQPGQNGVPRLCLNSNEASITRCASTKQHAIRLRGVTKEYKLYPNVREQALDVLGLSGLRFWRRSDFRVFRALDGIDLDIGMRRACRNRRAQRRGQDDPTQADHRQFRPNPGQSQCCRQGSGADGDRSWLSF